MGNITARLPLVASIAGMAFITACGEPLAPEAPFANSAPSFDAAATSQLIADVNGDATISEPGHYVGSGTFRTVTINASGVTLDGFSFVGGGEATAVKNGVAGIRDITIRNSSFSGYTGRSITFGFAEGVPLKDDRGQNITIANNSILQSGNNATAVAVFNTDGVTITDNVIRFTDGTTGRRGFNIDGDSRVVVTGNRLLMNDLPDNFTASPWAIQLSMSDAATQDVLVQQNEIRGATFGVVGLSQRGMQNIRVISNNIRALAGIAFNSGAAPPTAGDPVFSDIQIHGNRIAATVLGVYLRSLHTPTSTVTFRNVDINGNVVEALGSTTTSVRVDPTGNGFVLENVKFNGNPLR